MSSEEPRRIPSLDGRTAFVLALHLCWPNFWINLRDAWKSNDPGAFESWACAHHVVDGWLREACFQVMADWDSDPSPSWWERIPIYIPSWPVPIFEPVLQEPFPRYDGSWSEADLRAVNADQLPALLAEVQTHLEPIKHFEKRMLSQFKAQLRRYTKIIRQARDFDASPNFIRDAKWTALVFAGVPRAGIARESSDLLRETKKGPAYWDAEAAVVKAVSRFAAAIELKLPKNRL